MSNRFANENWLEDVHRRIYTSCSGACQFYANNDNKSEEKLMSLYNIHVAQWYVRLCRNSIYQ